MSETIGIIGAGAWGTAMAIALARNGHTVKLWVRSEILCHEINTHHLNNKYLPGYRLDHGITAYTNLKTVCKNTSLLLFATPSMYLAETVKKLIPFLPCHAKTDGIPAPVIGILTKGFIPDDNEVPLLLVDMVEKIIPSQYKNTLVYIAGPSHGEEVAAGKLTGLIAASKNPLCSIHCREMLKSRSLLVYSSLDIIGVQICAASKNVIAIVFGMMDAVAANSNFIGDNTESLLLAAGLNEIQVIGRAMGATHLETFTSISGIGDLDVTCRSRYGRNRRFGQETITKNILGNFNSIDDLIARIDTIGYLPEGVIACKYIYTLTVIHSLRLPICTGLYRFLNKELTPQDFLENLLAHK